MGKGDKKTRRGKLYRGTFGKRRPRPRKIRQRKKAGRTTA
ncbi:MAG: 30S ribosomal protein THX [Gemmatimonadales bacterium]